MGEERGREGEERGRERERRERRERERGKKGREREREGERRKWLYGREDRHSKYHTNQFLYIQNEKTVLC